jgi:hypothetical protein
VLNEYPSAAQSFQDVPVPMKILAEAGALAFAVAWKGVGAAFGKDSIWTFTGRWSSRDSVKNRAYREDQDLILGPQNLAYLLCVRLRVFSRLRRDTSALDSGQRDINHLVVTVGHEEAKTER